MAKRQAAEHGLSRGSRSERFAALWAVLIGIASMLPYLPSLRWGFTRDDGPLIVDCPQAHSLHFIAQAFTRAFVPKGAVAQPPYYRPLVVASYQADYSASGGGPLAFHLTNVLLNAVLVMLIFALARRLTKGLFTAAVAALVFATLPGHAESVAWVTGRTDIMSTLFTVGALIAFIAAHDSGGRIRGRSLLACSALFLCGLVSKENALILPLLIAGYIWAFGRPLRRDELLKWAASLAVPLAVYLSLRHIALASTPALRAAHPLGERLLGVGIAYAHYLRMLFIPCEPRVAYDILAIGITSPALAVAAWSIPIAMVLIAVFLRRRLPVLAFGLLWITAALIPVSGAFPVNALLPAERFSYFAGVGSALVIGWCAARAYDLRMPSLRTWRVVVAALAAWFVLYGAALTVSGSAVYSSNLAWARAIATEKPRLPYLRQSAATILAAAGQTAEAARQFEAAFELSRRDIDDHLDLAAELSSLGLFRRSAGTLVAAECEFGPDARVEHSIGLCRMGLGDVRGAAFAFGRAVALDPRMWRSWEKLAEADQALGKCREAAEAYRRAYMLCPPKLAHRLDIRRAYEGASRPQRAARR